MSAIIPFAEWLGIARSARNRHRAVLLLQAYFDESGISAGENLTAISGFIATGQTWLDFDAYWRGVLRDELKDLGLTWFHMSDCENGTKQFAPWNSKPELRRFAARTMADIIVRSRLTGFWVTLDAADWAGPEADELRKVYPKPYHFCFESVIRQVVEWVDIFAPGETVELIFSEQREYEGAAQDIYSAYMQAKQTAPLDSLRFVSMQKCAPLQAADLVVYSVNKEFDRGKYGNETQHQVYQIALDRLAANPASFTGRHFDSMALLVASGK